MYIEQGDDTLHGKKGVSMNRISVERLKHLQEVYRLSLWFWNINNQICIVLWFSVSYLCWWQICEGQRWVW